MTKNIESKGKNESVNGLEVTEELNVLKENVGAESLEYASNIQLSELGQYDNVGNFHIREDIQGEDENGKYIEVRGQKYYEDSVNGLIYSVRRESYSDSDIIYLGAQDKDGYPEGYGTKYTQSYIYEGLWNKSIPTNGKLTKFDENGMIKSIYNGSVNKDFNPNGNGIIEYCSSRATYEGNRVDGKKHGHGIYTYPSGTTYEGDWSNNKIQEGEGIMVRKGGKQRYVGYFLIDSSGNPHPFYDIIKDNKDRLLDEGIILNKNMRGRLTNENSFHEYSITNGSISEKANDFITMYGDNKKDEDRSSERGEILYVINYSSDSHIEYSVTSRHGKNTKRKFDGNQYQFKDQDGNILSIPASSNFGEKEALHVGNLVNKLIYEHQKHNIKYGFGYDKNNNLVFRISKTCGHYGNSQLDRDFYYIDSYEISNGPTIVLENVPKHFGGIEASTLAKWLNNAKGISEEVEKINKK